MDEPNRYAILALDKMRNDRDREKMRANIAAFLAGVLLYSGVVNMTMAMPENPSLMDYLMKISAHINILLEVPTLKSMIEHLYKKVRLDIEVEKLETSLGLDEWKKK